MVVLVMCGFPSSGKSFVAEKIAEKYKLNKSVIVISENDIDDKNVVYRDRKKELNLRNKLKSKLINSISAFDIVILDAYNHTKSFRYEIYCLCKEQSCKHVVIYTKCSQNNCIEYNRKRNENFAYDETLINEMFAYFEYPDPSNRWDCPLVIFEDINNIDFDLIDQAIFNNATKMKPNESTKPLVLLNDDYLNHVNEITQKITDEINEHITQRKLHKLKDKLDINRSVSYAELQKIRRTFLVYLKNRPIADSKAIENSFYSYINKNIGT